MPVLEVHLVEGKHASAHLAELLETMSARCAEVLDTPIDRVRAYVTAHAPDRWAAGGVAGAEAPYFTATLLEGRSGELRRRLLGALTDVLVDVVGADRRLVRGRIVQVDPDDWAIGGVSASIVRGRR
ncbi:tautomerase family protein [Pseudonocardia sp. TRM90224]|uniref:tautomerase family protein n=1 Tax=Pseudonocardia sp. TRM90224 TaxID=2812678 RepID=UPI001E4674FB|nr:tautomerase family protein [Pseudonocardia sp. TRM90224]